jgi:Domain of unknown function (DUF4062)
LRQVDVYCFYWGGTFTAPARRTAIIQSYGRATLKVRWGGAGRRAGITGINSEHATTILGTMEKRYQVFISSTYADLKEERRAVIQTVIESNCIPAGMELFPAADEEQLAFIKRVIDDCDYYLLIIGGRYGSVDESGISYTEQEYDYAVSRGLWVIALLHDNPE